MVDMVRDAAVDVLLRVFEGRRPLDESLEKTVRRRPMSDRGRRFLSQLAYGTVRHQRLADHVLAKRCHIPLADLPLPILTVLRMGVFQALFCNQVNFPSMVNTSVDLAKKRGHAGTARLVNAVLRKVPETLDLVKMPTADKDWNAWVGVRYSFPEWLVECLRKDLGEEDAERFCAAADVEAPLMVRVNLQEISDDEFVQRLSQQGIAVEPVPGLPQAYLWPHGVSFSRMKMFQEGCFTVQDGASMLPGFLLEPKPGDRIADLCAAPGGKTLHMAELAEGKARMVGMDLSLRRLYGVQENSLRMRGGILPLVCGDGAQAPFADETFDKVLVDAPCSGLGTLRRNPDIKWRLTEDSPARLAQQQLGLLRSALRLCKPGGMVVYSVCTITAAETLEVASALLHESQAALEDGPEFMNTWKINTGQYRVLPGDGVLDGFYLTRFRKQS